MGFFLIRNELRNGCCNSHWWEKSDTEAEKGPTGFGWRSEVYVNIGELHMGKWPLYVLPVFYPLQYSQGILYWLIQL